MAKATRRFDILRLQLEDVETYQAWKQQDEICFRYSDALMFQEVRKRNTAFFDALTLLKKLRYQLSQDVLPDFVFDAVTIAMAPAKDAASIQCGQQLVDAQQLLETLYHNGFTIDGIPGNQSRIHYVPYVSSASMSRKAEYLFVNDRYAPMLMERATLGLVSMVDGEPRLAGGFPPKADFISVPKLAAYTGLFLSDGVSLRELTLNDAPLNGLLNLTADNTVCVDDLEDFSLRLSRFPIAWGVNGKAERPVFPLAPGKKLALSGDQRHFQRFIQLLHGSDREQYDCWLEQHPEILPLWQQLVREEIAQLEKPKKTKGDKKTVITYHDGPLPCANDEEMTGGNIASYALLYALTAHPNAFTALRLSDGAPEKAQLSPAVLCNTVSLLGAGDRSVRDHLWKQLHPANNKNDRMITVLCAQQAEGLLQVQFSLRSKELSVAMPMSKPGDSKLDQGTLSDGVGFLDVETFEKLETLLYGNAPNHRKLCAFQIRLPWLKGLLVKVDFTSYWKEKGAGDLFITDVFNQRRQWLGEDGSPKLRAVFTKSMFKGYKYFKNLCNSGEAWQEYFRRLEEYEAAVVIAGTDSPEDSTSHLNYQFLTSLGLSHAQTQSLVKEQLEEITNLYHKTDLTREELEHLMKLLFPGQTYEDPTEEVTETQAEEASEENTDDADPEDSDPDDLSFDGVRCSALCKNPGLLASAYFRRQANALLHNRVLELSRGRFAVAGDVRYAIPDLKAVLDWLYDRKIMQRTKGAVRSVINSGAGLGSYYAPGTSTPWQPDSRVCVLRNPHYAPAECVILSPMPEVEKQSYDHFFGHLTGCAMIPALCAASLNGADFDGDRIHLVSDPVVVTAVDKAANNRREMLTAVLDRREELFQLTQQLMDKHTDTASYHYLLALQQLIRSLPDSKGLCDPPIVYGGSNSRSGLLTAKDLEGNKLKNELWRCFCASTKQQIGSMSLDLLDTAAHAYSFLNHPDWQSASAQELLTAFLAMHRLYTQSLRTAMEIDLAKTGLQLETYLLDSIPDALAETLCMKQGRSLFRNWRSSYERNRNALNSTFETAYNKMSAAWEKDCKKDGDKISVPMPLELLPLTVRNHYTNHKKKLRKQPSAKPLSEFMNLPVQAEDVEKLTQCEPQLTALFMEQLNAYNRSQRNRRRSDQTRINLRRRYHYIIRYLLSHGYSLLQSWELTQQLTGIVDEWQANHTGALTFESAVWEISNAITDETRAKWGWSDHDQRRRMLSDLLPDSMQLSDAEDVLIRHADGLILLNHLLRFGGLKAMLLASAATIIPGASRQPATPDALKQNMLATIARCIPGSTEEECSRYFQLCCCFLNNPSYKLLSDFLFIYLMGEDFVHHITEAKGGDAE